MSGSPSAVVYGQDFYVEHQGLGNNGELWQKVYKPGQGGWQPDFKLDGVGLQHSSPPSSPPFAGMPTPGDIILARLLNEYRRQNGLAEIRTSEALSQVARLHVRDLFENHPDQGVDGRGVPCNGHSWSKSGNWTAVCYTGDHLYAQSMWSKPREIANYPGMGFEIAAFGSDSLLPEEALSEWKSSPEHNAVILEQGVWANKHWPAFGVGMYRGYAVVWFGDVSQ